MMSIRYALDYDLSRARSVKHAEFEILMGLAHTTMEDISVDTDRLCVDEHSLKRFHVARKNLAQVFRNMMGKRQKYLPEDHMYHEGVNK